MISHVISAWSATWSVHDQAGDECMIRHVISSWSGVWSVHDHLNVHLSSLGPVPHVFPSCVNPGCTTAGVSTATDGLMAGIPCPSWVLSGPTIWGSWNGLTWWLQHLLFTDMADNIFHSQNEKRKLVSWCWSQDFPTPLLNSRSSPIQTWGCLLTLPLLKWLANGWSN